MGEEPIVKLKPIFLLINSILCIAGVIFIIVFALGMETAQSKVNQWMAKLLPHSLGIVLSLLGFCGLLLIPFLVRQKGK